MTSVRHRGVFTGYVVAENVIWLIKPDTDAQSAKDHDERLVERLCNNYCLQHPAPSGAPNEEKSDEDD